MVRFRHALHVCNSTCVQSEDKKKKTMLAGQGNTGRTVQSHFQTGAIPRVTRSSKRVSISQLT